MKRGRSGFVDWEASTAGGNRSFRTGSHMSATELSDTANLESSLSTRAFTRYGRANACRPAVLRVTFIRVCAWPSGWTN